MSNERKLSDFVHVSIDLETLDTKSSAVVLSIGASAVGEEMDTGFYTTLKIPNQIERGRTTSPETKEFWGRLYATDRNVYVDTFSERLPPSEAIEAFCQYIVDVERMTKKPAFLWAKGSDFDFPILKSLFETYQKNLDDVVHFRNRSCLRGLQLLYPEFVAKIGKQRYGVHNAYTDAAFQGALLFEIINKQKEEEDASKN